MRRVGLEPKPLNYVNIFLRQAVFSSWKKGLAKNESHNTKKLVFESKIGYPVLIYKQQ